MTEETNNEAEKHFNNTKGRYDELLRALALETNQEITDKHKVLIIEDDTPSSLMRAELTKTFGEDIIIISQKDLSKETKEKLPLINEWNLPEQKPIPIQTLKYKDSYPMSGKERRRKRRKK